MSTPGDDARARWDAYWRHGFLTSCADAFEGNYAGSIARHWDDTFRALPDGACVLDVCTGNGAVAALAARHALERKVNFQIIGVDLATIEPAVALRDAPDLLAMIDFRARTPADATGLPSESVDLVMGQYAIEYTPLEQTFAELARIVRPGGTLSLVLHDPDSVILRTTHEELTHRARLSPPNDVISAAHELGTCVAGARARGVVALDQDPTAEAARHRLNDAAARITEAARESAHPEILLTALQHARQIFAAGTAGDATACTAAAEAARAELAANFARLDDLVNAAGAGADRGALAELAGQHGFENAEHGDLRHDNLLIGWIFTAHRPG